MKKVLTYIFCFIIMFSVFNVTMFTSNTTNVVKAAGGANSTAMDNLITSELNASDGSSTWQKYLNDEWRSASSSFGWVTTGLEKWTGATSSMTASASQTPETDPMVIPAVVNGYYEIYFGEQLRYALLNTTSITQLKLMQDIDLNGDEFTWAGIANLTDYTFDGNNHTIYNLGSTDAFVKETIRGTFFNVTFDSGKIVSKTESYMGFFAKIDSTSFHHIRFQNSIIFSAYPTYNAIWTPSYAAPLGHSVNITADYIATVNNYVYALKAHIGGAFGAIERATISNSYSVDSVVVAGGDHSGGFISCANGGNTVSNSFTNNTVYGNKETGVFIGALVDNNTTTSNVSDVFSNCFTSGTIEGTDQLGGFIGLIGNGSIGNSGYSATFYNCYSTSIVGMRNGGTNLGGFIGYTEANSGETYFNDCFAAGEVGAIDTDVSANRTTSTVGGFIGSSGSISHLHFANSYYDKQTTAMREWEAGFSRDAVGTEDAGLNNIAELTGVLTSNSDKYGAGLASQPDETLATGFKGFSGDTYDADGMAVNSNWIYDGGNKDASLHNCMYPQLAIFFNSKDALVRAFSYASVATVHEQVWDTCTHGKPLTNTTYDTVRDLTSRFTLTSYVDNPRQDELATSLDITWTKEDATSSLYGQQKQVIGLLTEAENSKYHRKYWTADKFSLGTEWVKVEFTIVQDGKTVVGSRRLRIIPTSNITPGVDQIDIVTGDTYNHAKDMYMAYSSASRMAIDPLDITTGVYPDSLPFTSSDVRNSIQSINTNVTSQFALDAKNFIVGAEHMTGGNREVNGTHPNNIIITYLYGVSAFDETIGDDVAKIIYGTKDDAIISPDVLSGLKGEERKSIAEEWTKKLTGEESLDADDVGRYMIEYEWVLPDGRYMRDSKMIMVQSGKHSITTEVRNSSDNTLNNASFSLSIDKFDHTSAIPTPTFTQVTSKKSLEVKHGEAANMAFKPENTNASIDKIVFEFKIGDIVSSAQNQTIVIDNVQVGVQFDVPISYYYTSYEESDNYYAKRVETIKHYTLNQDASGYYYLTLNQEFNDASTGVIRQDIECDVKATIYVTDQDAVNTGSVNVITKTFIDDTATYTTDVFTYKIVADDGTTYDLDVTSEDGANKSLTLPVGNYRIEQGQGNGYAIDSVMLKDKEVTAAPYSFTVTTDETSSIVFNMRKRTEKTGTAILSTQTFLNDEQIYESDTFAYAILDNNDKEIQRIDVSSLKDITANVVLPVGDYKIKPLNNNGYQLISIRMGSEVVNEPYSFSITNNATTNILVKYQKDTDKAGRVSIANETFVNGEQVFLSTSFMYQILDSNGSIVKNFTLTSESEQTVDYQLPVGTYSIVQSETDGFTLESMTINGSVTSQSPFVFTIGEAQEVQVIAKNVSSTTSLIHTGLIENVTITYIVMSLLAVCLFIYVYRKKKLIK